MAAMVKIRPYSYLRGSGYIYKCKLWCEKELGAIGDRWDYYIVENAFVFTHEEDAVIFKLAFGLLAL